MQENRSAALFSDFDGTVVKKLSNKNPWRWPQNMAKYPLKRIEGWADFVNGVLEVEGIHYREIVTRRPNIYPRRLVTRLSLAKTGLGSDFDRVAYAGNEGKKAMHLAKQAVELAGRTNIGMIEDRPDKLVPELIHALSDIGLYPELMAPKPRIVVGVVNDRLAKSRVERTADLAEKIRIDKGWDGFYYGARPSMNYEGDLTISSGKMEIEVVQLPPFSFTAGVEFGERLVS